MQLILRFCTAIFLVATFPFLANAQTIPQQSNILDPEKIVKWSYTAKETAANEYDLVITANIEKGWFIYSQNMGKGGPVPTSFKFDKTSIQAVGTAVEHSEHTKSYMDGVFKMQVTKFSDKVVFTQHLKTLKTLKTIAGSLRFMTCNDKTCLPPIDVSFSVNLPIAKIAEAAPIATKTPQTAAKNVVIPAKTTASTLKTSEKTPVSAKIPATPQIPATPSLPVAKTNLKTNYLQPKALASSPAQNPVKWSVFYSKSGNDYGLSARATIEKGWYILASLQNESSVQPTTFSLADKNNALLAVMNERGHRNFKADANFQNKKVAIFEGDAVFSQHLQVKNPAAMLQGMINYQVCNADGCLPLQTEKFNLKLSEQTPIIAAAQVTPTEDNPEKQEPQPVTETPKTPEKELAFDTKAPDGTNNFPGRYNIVSDSTVLISKIGEIEKSGTSAFSIFLQGFLGGLLALLTPCVFPLIPMTVSFFLNRSKTRNEGIKNAFLYGFSIIFIYVFIGIVLTSIFGATLGNTLATHWIPNLLFFIVFTVFALSFFGYFDLTLPSSWANKTDEQADKGGFIGIFFMALTLVIVSFSCTGPVLGTLLVQAVTADNAASIFGIKLLPLVGMLGFSGALALPFGLFALFPTWLKSLPKSGGWMNTLKVNFAFIELLLAVKFLSNIDLVYFKDNINFYGGILRWEPFLVLWALLFLGMGLYNFGFIRFPHDDKNAEISWTRKIWGGISTGFMAYCIFGLLTYDSLATFSGLVPPPYYNFFHRSPKSTGEDCPLEINCHRNNLDEAIEAAAASNKPLFIDFTGDACVNCRKTENNIWTLSQISPYIKDSMVVVSLICDSREELPETAIYESKFDQREVNKIGKAIVDLQITHFGSNSQPLYVPLYVDPQDHHKLYRLTKQTIGYPGDDMKAYEDYLKQAMQNFRNVNSKK